MAMNKFSIKYIYIFFFLIDCLLIKTGPGRLLVPHLMPSTTPRANGSFNSHK